MSIQKVMIVLLMIFISACTHESENTISIQPLIASGNDFVLYYDREKLYGIGNNEHGQLGISDEITSTSRKTEIPIELSVNEYIVELHAGYSHSGILTSQGRVFMWGSNTHLQVAMRDESIIDYPLEISYQWDLNEDEKITNLVLGGFHTGVLTSNNRVILFGLNSSGQIGNGKTSLSVANHQLQYPSEHTLKLSLGSEHSGLIVDQEIYVWGSNFNGQLGLGDVSNQLSPRQLTSINIENDESVSLALGVGVSIIYTDYGNVYGFGKSVYGILGEVYIENDVFEPKRLEYLNLEDEEFITNIQFGYGHATFKTSNHRFLNIGSNTLSQLGNASKTIIFNPLILNQDVKFKNENIDKVVNGGFFQVVLLNNGRLYASGYNLHVFNTEDIIKSYVEII